VDFNVLPISHCIGNTTQDSIENLPNIAPRESIDPIAEIKRCARLLEPPTPDLLCCCCFLRRCFFRSWIFADSAIISDSVFVADPVFIADPFLTLSYSWRLKLKDDAIAMQSSMLCKTRYLQETERGKQWCMQKSEETMCPQLRSYLLHSHVDYFSRVSALTRSL